MRGRAWALWKALVTYVNAPPADKTAVAPAHRAIDELVTELVTSSR